MGQGGELLGVFGRRLTSRTRSGPPLLIPFCPHSSEDKKVKPPSTWEELTHFPFSPRLRGADGAHGGNQGGSWGSQAKVWVSCSRGLLPAHVRAGRVEPRQDLGNEGLAGTDDCILVPAFSPTLGEVATRQDAAQQDY